MIKILPFFTGVILLLPLCVVAQEKLSRSYTVKDGLASNTIYGVLADYKGFLWFATDAGVSKFDGTSFTNFSTTDGLADNDVLGMLEDEEGRIWFLCFNQQPCFYYKGRFYNAGNFPELRKIRNYNWHIVYSDRHELWFAGRESLFRFAANKITEYPVPGGKNIILVTRIDSVMLVVKDSLFYYLDAAHGRFERFAGLTLSTNELASIDETGNGKYLIVDQKDFKHTELYTYNIDIRKRTAQKRLCCAYDKDILHRAIDKKGQVLKLIFADNTIVEKELRTDSLQDITQYQVHAPVSDFVSDLQGNKWYALLHGGVEMYPRTKSNIVSIPQPMNTSSTYYSILKVNGDYVVGNNDNALLFVANGQLRAVRREYFYSANNRIVDIKRDKHGLLWLGTDNDVCTYDMVRNKFAAMHTETNVKDIKYDERADAMLFASSRGSFYIGCKGDARVHAINGYRTICIAGSLTDTCWYETLDGLYLYTAHVSIPDTALNRAIGSRATCLELDGKNRLWVGTSSNGVFLAEHNKVTAHFTVADGLTSNICKNIFIDEYNNAWVSTNLGVSHIRVDQLPYPVTIYNDKNSLADNDVNDVLVAHDTVWVVSSTGITYFALKNISNNYGFPVYITKVKTGGNETGADDTSAIRIASSDNALTIAFSGLSYLSDGDIKYEYYVKELNRRPLYTKNSSVTYSSLSPGVYNFFVSATDAFGNKSLKPAHLQFRIVPEWYQRLWLRWLAGLALLSGAVFVTYKYVNQQEKRKRLQSELKQTISRLELEAIRLQINPHFIFNCLNAIQNAIYKNNAEEAGYFINRFAKLMRKALMLSKESFISIDEECSFINNYLEVEQLRHNKSFDYTIEIDSTLNKSTPFIPAFVLQPFIENAINHGVKYLKQEKGLITLQFRKTDKLEIYLKDNGIGIEASRKLHQHQHNLHSSKGIELMLARVESLNKIYHKNIQIRIIDNRELDAAESGTTIVISLDLI